ncbi:MAG: hypothetical protein JWN98_646 [Abditibacteriota bacterium]|nr:hypothetical protein [Abditibacteriota bacterium]
MNTFDYDLAVIGAGTAGLVSAVVASSLDAKVLLIERDRVGGECLWTGCVPSKTLIRSARAFDQINRSEEFGIHIEKQRVVWSAVRLRIADVRDEIKALERRELERSNVELLSGTATFVDHHTLRVATKAGDKIVRARKFILATGTKARLPEIEGLAEAGFITHEQIFDLPNLPRSLAIIGGGPIGCEFAQAFARLGCKVTLIQSGAVLLPKEDAEISEAAARVLRNSGVTLHLGAKVLSVHGDDDGKHITLESAGESHTLRASQILVATGKTPDLKALNLAAVGVKTDERSVIVDDQLKTTAKNIWACGDITGKYLFTHVAEYQGKIAAQNALLPAKARVDYRVVPWTTFTDPEISHLGQTEEEARQEWGDCRVFRQPFKELDRAIIEGETDGFLKVVTTPNGRVVGVHIIGPGAGELIHTWIPAVKDGALIHEFGEAIHVYPTLSEINHRAGNDAYRQLLEGLKENRVARWVLRKIVG